MRERNYSGIPAIFRKRGQNPFCMSRLDPFCSWPLLLGCPAKRLHAEILRHCMLFVITSQRCSGRIWFIGEKQKNRIRSLFFVERLNYIKTWPLLCVTPFVTPFVFPPLLLKNLISRGSPFNTINAHVITRRAAHNPCSRRSFPFQNFRERILNNKLTTHIALNSVCISLAYRWIRVLQPKIDFWSRGGP